jgi:hypothetical protein
MVEVIATVLGADCPGEDLRVVAQQLDGDARQTAVTGI